MGELIGVGGLGGIGGVDGVGRMGGHHQEMEK